DLGRQWGIGQRDKDNGLFILVAREERRVFIATGYGLEGAITDAFAARVIRTIITPAFRQGQFYGGLSEATDALIAAAEGEFQADDLRQPSRPIPISGELVFLLLIIAFFVISNLRSGGGRGGQRYRRGGGGPPVIIWGGGGFGGGGSFGGGGFGGGFGGGGSFGGGGAGGGW
ncbi:MAG: TPM domain-containing protein, partial [Bacteroidota bacterium]